MPLCPQITNTPITVTQTADFTVSSVLPVVPATTTQVDAADAAAQQALIDAQIAQDAADAAAAVAATSAAAAAAAQASATAANATAASAVTTANSAAAAAGTAQSTANTALANAATAYTAAIGSLQPSASTIVNASNQMTAINGGGITVYSGASATTGARVVLNSAGLAGFNSSSTGPGNGATFSISASTGAAVFSGSVTGSTITGGTLNIGGNAIIDASGLLTATGATITGEIRGTSGYFGTATNGFSISSTGLVGVGTGTIVGGVIQGAQFTNGSTFSVSPTGFLIASAGTIGGLTLSGSSIASATGGFSVTSAGVLTAISGTIGGLTLASNSISSITGGFSVTSAGVLTAATANITGTINATGGYIGSAANGWNFNSAGYLTNSGFSTILYPTTAPGGNANTYAFYSDRGVFGSSLYASSSSQGAITTLGGIQADGRLYTAAGNFVVNTSGNITAVGSIAATGAITTSGNISTSGSGTITSAGSLTGASLTVNGSATFGTSNTFEYLSSSGTLRSLYTYGVARSASTRTLIIDSSGNFGTSASTRRKKHEIESYKIDSQALLNLDVKTFKYNPDIDPAQSVQYGFIAEEAQDLGLDELIQYDSTGIPDYFSYEKLPIFLLQLIQELKAEINQLKGE